MTTSAKFRFEPGDLLRLGGVDHVYVRPADGGHVLHRPDCSFEQVITHADLATYSQAASFLVHRGFYSEGGAFARQRAGVSSLNEIPAAECANVLYQEWWVTRFLDAEARQDVSRSDASMTEFIEREQIIAAQLPYATVDSQERKARAGSTRVVREPPCAKTLRTWVKTYQRGGCQAHALRTLHRKCGNRKTRLLSEAHAALDKVAQGYLSEKQPSVESLYKDLKDEMRRINEARHAVGKTPLATPSRKALRKRIKSLPAFEIYAGRHGLEAARRHFLLAAKHYPSFRVGERVEMDEWTIHAQTLLTNAGVWHQLSEQDQRAATGRYVLNIAVDVATRCVVGLALGATATSQLALAALRSLLRDKTALAQAAGCSNPWNMACTPELVVTDGGSALIADNTRAALRSMGTHHRVPPSKRPEKRPFIERFNRTIGEQFLQFFTGRTFSNVGDKGDYDSQLRASLTLDALKQALVRWIVDVYHQTPHAGLGGKTPAQAWEELSHKYGVCPPPGSDAQRHIFGTEMTRKVTLQGIRVAGLYYSDRDLAEAILQHGLHEVTIRIDPDDLGAISLESDGNWRTIPCGIADVRGLALENWTRAARLAAAQAQAIGATRQEDVRKAIADIKAIAASCEAAVGIDRLQPSAEEIAGIENSLLATVRIMDAAEMPDGADPFATAIAVTGDALLDATTPGVPSTASAAEESQSSSATDDRPASPRPASYWIED